MNHERIHFQFTEVFSNDQKTPPEITPLPHPERPDELPDVPPSHPVPEEPPIVPPDQPPPMVPPEPKSSPF